MSIPETVPDRVQVPAIAACPPPAGWPYSLSDWAPLFEGVHRCVGTADSASGVAGNVARKQVVNAVRVDLSVIPEMVVTPGVSGGANGQTIGQTIGQFMQANPHVSVAVNTNFSASTDGTNFVLFGLSVSAGSIVCDPFQAAWKGSDPDVSALTDAGSQALVIQQGNRASIVSLYDGCGTDCGIPEGTWWAVAGSPEPEHGNPSWPPQAQFTDPHGNFYPALLVENGCVLPAPSATPRLIAARTAIGISAPDPDWPRYLYIVTLDGREQQSSDNETISGPYGGDFSDIAQWLALVGADKGFNLDGGGSTVMARRGSDPSSPILMNVPYGGEHLPMVERTVGTFLGIVAYDLPK